jgi:anti-anti-sigma regulatory factor
LSTSTTVREGPAAPARDLAEVLQIILEGTADTTGDAFLRSFARHLASALRVRYAFVSKCVDWPTTRVRTLAFWMGDRYGDDFEYALEGTPCAGVLEGETCFYPDRIQQLFPHDKDLVTIRAESYLGIPLKDRASRILGHLAVLDDKPMSAADLELRQTLLRIFAARAAAELERLRQELTLKETQGRLEAAVSAMSTPIIQVWDGVLALPVIGSVDFERAGQMMEALLQAIVRTRSRFAVLDLTGVEAVDTATADHLLKIVRAVRMLGAQGIITGIRPAVAQTMISLGIELAGIATLNNLQEALRACMKETTPAAVAAR